MLFWAVTIAVFFFAFKQYKKILWYGPFIYVVLGYAIYALHIEIDTPFAVRSFVVLNNASIICIVFAPVYWWFLPTAAFLMIVPFVYWAIITNKIDSGFSSAMYGFKWRSSL